MKRLQDRIAVVTGAGSGIGRATAVALADRGCRVAAVDVAAARLDETRALAAARGGDARPFVTDVSDAAAMDALAERVESEMGAAHIVVNNAGVSVTARFDEHTLEDFEHVLGVNLWGVIHGCRVFLPQLRRADEAHIVNVSSVFGIVGVGGQAAYSASKFAVRGLTETLHEELVGTHIGVSVVHPGCIATNIVASGKMLDADMQQKSIDYFRRNGMAPDLVARRIVRAIERNEHRVLVTREAFLLDWMRRAAPYLGNRLANEVMARAMRVERDGFRIRVR